MLFFINDIFVFLSKSRHFTRGSQTVENIQYVIVTFETEVAYLKNDIASEKWPKNQNSFIKINDLGVILL